MGGATHQVCRARSASGRVIRPAGLGRVPPGRSQGARALHLPHILLESNCQLSGPAEGCIARGGPARQLPPFGNGRDAASGACSLHAAGSGSSSGRGCAHCPPLASGRSPQAQMLPGFLEHHSPQQDQAKSAAPCLHRGCRRTPDGSRRSPDGSRRGSCRCPLFCIPLRIWRRRLLLQVEGNPRILCRQRPGSGLQVSRSCCVHVVEEMQGRVSRILPARCRPGSV